MTSIAFLEDFDGSELDLEVWVPHYLPQWSSRALSAATYEVAGSELRLTIPPDHGVWCEGDHEPPLRVSGVQSGVFSGPVGSTVGQQPFRDGQMVLEEQPARWGWTPQYGRIEVRARMELSPRSMASVWMVGLEREPQESGEICIFEVFGDAPQNVGSGIKPFRDPALSWEFDAPRMEIDPREAHVYAVDWHREGVEFLVDGDPVRRVQQSPDYPMQLMVAVFDFPEKDPGGKDGEHVPMLAVDSISGSAS